MVDFPSGPRFRFSGRECLPLWSVLAGRISLAFAQQTMSVLARDSASRIRSENNRCCGPVRLTRSSNETAGAAVAHRNCHNTWVCIFGGDPSDSLPVCMLWHAHRFWSFAGNWRHRLSAALNLKINSNAQVDEHSVKKIRKKIQLYDEYLCRKPALRRV